jgi:DNA polymerase bacteriophage-type
MVVTIDFETRCAVDIAACGPWKYAEDPTCTPICCAFQVDDQEPRVWVNDWAADILEFCADYQLNEVVPLSELLDAIEKADKIEAHNAEFERAIWHHHMPGELPIHKVHCTAARAAMAALPRALAYVCQVLKLAAQKDTEGGRIMKSVSLPKKDGSWDNEPMKLLKTIQYCLQDVRAERALSKVLPELPASERAVWLLDQRINGRGIQIDTQGARNLINLVDGHVEKLLAEFRVLTQGNPESPTQVQKFLDWCKMMGTELDNMQAEPVDKVIKTLEDGNPVKRALQIRRSVSKSSVAKFHAMIARAQNDDRARSLFMYHGAGTGRWSGAGIQPQNLPSRKVFKQPEIILDMLRDGRSAEFIEMTCGDPMWLASSCIRSCITATPGKTLFCGDYKSIEGRGLAWLAGEEYILQAYRAGADLYKVAAAGIYGRPVEEIKDGSFERQIGKVVELACGYQGGIGALSRMADSYGVKLPPPEETKQIIKSWRDSRPATTKLWRDMEKAAIMSIRNPGQIVTCGKIIYKTQKGALMMKLPSGRCLYYQTPTIGSQKVPWLTDDGQEQFAPCISFWGVDSTTKQWCEQTTYGGCLTENAVQALCRDLLVHGMQCVEASGKYEVVLHCHDECLSEATEGGLEEYLTLLTQKPDWAAGIPVAAEGWTGFRYRKG